MDETGVITEQSDTVIDLWKNYAAEPDGLRQDFLGDQFDAAIDEFCALIAKWIEDNP